MRVFPLLLVASRVAGVFVWRTVETSLVVDILAVARAAVHRRARRHQWLVG
jgi:hypothetical protein